MFLKKSPFLLLFCFAFLETGARAAFPPSDFFTRTYEARVIRVIDGDTFKAEIRLTEGLLQIVSIRLQDVDAPETRKRCAPHIRLLGKKAKEFLKKRLGKKVWLRNLERGKYAGRMLARVYTMEGVNVGDLLIQEGLARPYAQSGKRRAWCLGTEAP